MEESRNKKATRAQITARLSAYERISAPDYVLSGTVIGSMSEQMQQQLASPQQQAAVLIGLVERDNDFTIILTQRAAHLSRHAGQIAFPGGRIDPTDPSAMAAALREADEEIGLSETKASVIGTLDDHLTGTGFLVTPVVAFVDPDFRAKPDPAEVASVFELPIEAIRFADRFIAVDSERTATRFRHIELHYGPHRIWGATATMLNSLRKIIYKTNG